MRNHNLRASLASGGGGGGTPGSYTSGNWYPIFAIKVFNLGDTANASYRTDISSSPIISSRCEQPMQRALSFDTTNTTELDGTDTIAEICSILDTSYYTCNSDFGSGGETISGIKIEHWEDSSTKENEGQFEFNGSSFNIYDHACNVRPSNYDSTNNYYVLPSQLGTITSASLDGTALSDGTIEYRRFIFVNASSAVTTTNTHSYSGWGNDSGDYCFLGITDRAHSVQNADNLDTQFSNTKGLAFGHSDSDGVSKVGGVDIPPRHISKGIGRRHQSYTSLVTNWQHNDNTSHSGQTGTGYFIVYGKVN